MVSSRVIFIINVSLGLLCVLLLLMLLGVELPTLGQAQYLLDKEDPLCMVEWNGEFTKLDDVDRCCLQARGMLECQAQNSNDVDWVCSTGAGMKIWLNNKAYNYCKQQPYW